MTAYVDELRAEADRAQARSERLAARYNAEYRARLWDTNRPLAGQCEDAYSEAWRARTAYETAAAAAKGTPCTTN